MAAVQWSGGKMHEASEAKTSMLHDDKEERMRRGHANPDIDPSKTINNFSYRGLTYKQKCDRYDQLMEAVRIKRKSSGQNANVTLQKLEIPIPAEMQDDDKYDPAQVRAWMTDVAKILEEKYGALLIDVDCHVDEIHLYRDTRVTDPNDPKAYSWSRCHLHAAIVPAVWEPVKGKDGKPVKDENGKVKKELCLNATKFSSRKNITDLNNRIQEMTKQKYHMLFMDGSGAGKGGTHKTVEELKSESATLMRDESRQLAKDRESAREEREKYRSAKKKADAEAEAARRAAEEAEAQKKKADTASEKYNEAIAAADAERQAGERARKQMLDDAAEKMKSLSEAYDKAFAPRAIFGSAFGVLLNMSNSGYQVGDGLMQSMKRIIDSGDEQRMAALTKPVADKTAAYSAHLRRSGDAIRGRLESLAEGLMTDEERDALKTKGE